MIKANRTQSDDKGDKVSRDTALSFLMAEDVTRQEYKEETDIRTILRKYGVPNTGAPPAPDMTHTDFTIDLQEAYRIRDEGARLLARLPQEIRDKYKNNADLLTAIDNGELQKDILELAKPKPRDDDATTQSEGDPNRQDRPRRDMQLRMDQPTDRQQDDRSNRSQPPRLRRDNQDSPGNRGTND